ncbi:MAG: hypothetical protein ACLPZF_08360 [Candidatus Acidiferrales bacterium]
MGHLGKVLAEKGQRLALDAPPGATVGGVVAMGAAGLAQRETRQTLPSRGRIR